MANLYEKIVQLAEHGVYRKLPPAVSSSSKIEYCHITKANFDGSFGADNFDEKGRKTKVFSNREIPFGETPSLEFVPENEAPRSLKRFYE